MPASDFALGLTVGREFNSDMKQAVKLGVTGQEIDALCDAVLKALEKGPLDPDGIRAATGKASRSLGEEGKKKGLSTTLPSRWAGCRPRAGSAASQRMVGWISSATST